MDSKDLLCYKFGSVFSENDICFSTLTSATTISPKTKITLLNVGNDVVNITPPINNYHELVFIPLGDITFLAGGNIIEGRGFPTQSPAFFFYNPSNKKYYYIL